MLLIGEKGSIIFPKNERGGSVKRILVLGGGAAGIVAAIAAAEECKGNAEVLLLERNPRIGKKLLATGNGRCNLDNNRIRIEDYFTSDRESLEQMLKTIGDLERIGDHATNLAEWVEYAVTGQRSKDGAP